jgi:hypothetical protein
VYLAAGTEAGFVGTCVTCVRERTLLLEQKHGLWGRVHRQRVGPLHRAAALAGHAVAPPGVGKPQVLRRGGEKNKFHGVRPSVSHLHTSSGVFKSSRFTGSRQALMIQTLANNVRRVALWVMEQATKRAQFQLYCFAIQFKRLARGARLLGG